MAFQSSRLDGLDASARRRMLGGNSFNSFHSSAPPTPVPNDRHSDDDSSTATDLSYTISTIDTTEEGIPVAVVKNKPAAPPVTETSYVTPPRQTKIGGTTAAKTPGTVPMTRTPQSASSSHSGRGETPDVVDGDDDEISPTSTMTPPVLSSSPAKLPKMPGMPDSVSASRRGTAVTANSNNKKKSLFDEVMSRSSAGSIDGDEDDDDDDDYDYDDGDESDNDAIDQPAQSPLQEQEQEQEPPVQEESSPKKKDKTKKTKQTSPTSRLERFKLKAIKAASKELGMDSKMLAKAAGVDHTKVENAPDNSGGKKKDDDATVDVDFLSSALGLPASFFAATDSSPQRDGVSAAREPRQAEEDPVPSSTPRTIESNDQTMDKESAVESSSAELTRPEIGSLGDVLGMKIDTTSNAVPIREGSSAPTTSKSSLPPTAASASAVDMSIQPKDGSLANALGLKIDPNPTSSYIRVENQAPPPIMPYNGDSSALKYSSTTTAVPARGSLADALQMMIDPNADESAYIRKRGESPPPIMPYNEKSSALGYSSSKAEPATSMTAAPTRGSLADALQMSIDSSSQAPYIRKEGEEAGPPIMPYNEKSSALKYSTAATSEETTKAPARGSLADALQMTVDSSSQAPYIRKDGEAAPPIMPFNENSSALKYSTAAATSEETAKAPARGSLADALQMTVDSSSQAPYIRKDGEAAPPIMPFNENSSALKYSTAAATSEETAKAPARGSLADALQMTVDSSSQAPYIRKDGEAAPPIMPYNENSSALKYSTAATSGGATAPTRGSLADALQMTVDSSEQAPYIRKEGEAAPPIMPRNENSSALKYSTATRGTTGGKSLAEMVFARMSTGDDDVTTTTTTTSTSTGSGDDDDQESETYGTVSQEPQPTQEQPRPGSLANALGLSIDADQNAPPIRAENQAPPPPQRHEGTTFMGYAQKKSSSSTGGGGKQSLEQMVLAKVNLSDYDEEDSSDDEEYDESEAYDNDLKPQAQQQQQPKQVSGKSLTQMVLSNLNLSNDIEESSDEDESDSDSAQSRNLAQQEPTTFKLVTRENVPLPKKSMTQMVLSRLPTSFTDESQDSGSSTYDQDESDDDSQDDFALARNANTSEDKAIEVDTAASTSDESDTDESEDYFLSMQTASAGGSSLANALGMQVRPSPEVPQIRGDEDARKQASAPAPVLSSRPQKPSLEQMVLSRMSFDDDDDTATATTDESYLNESVNDFQSTLGTTSIEKSSTSQVPAKASQGPAKAPRSMAQLVLSRVSIDDVTVTSTSVGSSESDESEDDYNIIQKKAAPGSTALTKQKHDVLYETLEISSSDDDSSDEYENESAESKGRDLPQPGSLASALNMRIDPSASSAPIRQPGQMAPVVQQNNGTTFKGVQNTPFMSPDAQKSFADFVLSRVSYNLDENDVSSYDDGSSEEESSVGGNADNVEKARPSEVKPVQSQPVRRSSAPRSFAAMILSRVTDSMSDDLSYESSEDELSVDELSVDGVSAEHGKGVKNESTSMPPSETSQTPQKGSLAAALGMTVDQSAEAAFIRKEGERPPPIPVHNENSSALGYLTSNTNARKASNAPRPNSLAAALGMAIDPSAEAAYIRKEGESAPPVPEYNKNSSALGYVATSKVASPRPNSLAAALGMAIDPSAEAAYIRKEGDSAPPVPEYNKNSSALGYLATSKVASKFSTSPRPNSLAAALGMSIDPSSEAAYIRKEGESAPPVPVYNQDSSALGYLATSEVPKPSTSPMPNSLAAALGMSIDPSSEAAYIRKEGESAPRVPVYNQNSSALGYLATSEAPKPSTSPRPNSLAAALGMSIDPSSEAAYIRKEGERAPPVPVFNKNSSALSYLTTSEVPKPSTSPMPNSLAAALGMSIDPSSEAAYIRKEGERAPPVPVFNKNSSALGYLATREVSSTREVGSKAMPPRPNSLAAALGMSIDPNPEASYIREEGESAPPIPVHNENSSALVYLPKKPVPPRPNSLAAALGMTIDPSAEAAYIREEGESAPPIPVHNENSSALVYLPKKPVPPRPNSLAAALGMTIDPSAEAAYIREEGGTPPPVPVHNENSSALGYLPRKPLPPRPNSLAAALGMTIDPSAEAAYIREEGETPPPVPVHNENSSALSYLTTKQESLAEHEKNGAKTDSPSIQVSDEVASKSTAQTESEVAPNSVPAMPTSLAAALGMAVAPNHEESPVRKQGETPDEKDSDDESAPQVKNIDESDSYSESDTEYDEEETVINSVEENNIKEQDSVPQDKNVGSSLEAALGAPVDMDTAVAAIKQARSMSKSKKSLFDAAIVRMGLGDLGVPDNETPVEVPTPAEAIAAAEVTETSSSAKTFNTKESMLTAVLNTPARETMSAVESDQKDLAPELSTPARETTSTVESDQKDLAPEEGTAPVPSQALVRDAEKKASSSEKKPDRVASEPEAPQSEVDQKAEDQIDVPVMPTPSTDSDQKAEDQIDVPVMPTPSTDSDQKAEDQNDVPVMPTPSTDSDINRGVEKQDSSSKKTKSEKPQYKSRLERMKAKALRAANKSLESDASSAVTDGTESSSVAKPEQKPQNMSAVEPFAAADIASALGIPPSLLAPKKSRQEQPSVLKKTSQAETSADQKMLNQSVGSAWSVAAGVSQGSIPVDNSGPDSSRAAKPVTGNLKGGKPQYKSRKERVMAKVARRASQGMIAMPSTIPQMPDPSIQQQGNETSENPPKMSRLDRMKANAIKAASKDLGIDSGAFAEALGLKQQTPPASDAKPSAGKSLMGANEADIAGALGISPSLFGAGSKKSVMSNPVPPTENAVGSEDENVGLDVNDVAAALGMPISLLEGGGEPKRSKKSTKAKTAPKKIDLREEAEEEEGDGFYYSGGTPSLGSALEPVEPEENVDLLECMLPLDAVMQMRKNTSSGNLFALVAEDEKAAAAEDEKAAAVVTPEKETRQPKQDSAPKKTSVVADAPIPKSKSRSASEDNVIQLAADAPIPKPRSRSASEDDGIMREGTPSTAATTEREGMTAEANAKVTTTTATREVPPPANTTATKAESGIQPQPEANNAVPTQPQPMVNARRQVPPMSVNMEKVKAGMKYLEGQILDAKGYVSKVAQDMETLESRITKLESKPKDNGAASFKAELDAHTKRIEEKLFKTSSEFNDKLSVLETKVSNNGLQIEEKAEHIKTLESKIKAEKDERLIASRQWEETGSKLDKACDELQQSRTLLQQEYEDVKSVKISFKNHQSMVSKRLDDLQQQRDSVSKRLVHLHDSFGAVGNSTQGEGRKTSDVLRSIQHNLQKEGERRKSLTARLKSRAGVPVTACESKLLAAEPVAKEKGTVEAEEQKEKTTESSLSRALEVEPIVEGKTIVDTSLEKDREDEKAAKASLQKALEDERIVKEEEEATRIGANGHEHLSQEKTAEEDRIQKERVEEEARLKALEDERIAKEEATEEQRIAREKAAAEAARLKAIEDERIAKEKAAEEERITQEKAAAEAARLQAIEDERIAKEKAAEAARLEEERIAKEEELQRQKEEEEIRIAAEKAEAERIAKEQAAAAEAARLEEERLEQERIAAEEAAEAARLKALEDERIAAERAEAERLEQERIAAEEAAEAARLKSLEDERIAAERAEAERLEKERIAAAEEAAEAARLKALEDERIAAERAEAERLEQERIAAEQAAEAARLEEERIAAEKAAEAERLEQERVAAEEAAEAARLEEERIAAEKAAEAKRLEQERVAAEEAAEAARLEQERIVNEEAAAEAQRVEEERIAKEAAAEAERIAIEKAEEEARQVALQWSMMESAKLKALEDERVAEEKAEEARLKAYEEELLAQETAESERLKALEEERLAKVKADEEAAASQLLQVPEEDGKVVVQEKSIESVDVLTEEDVTGEADVEDETVTAKAKKKSSSWVMMLIIPWLLFFGSLYLASIVQEPIATIVLQTEDVSVPSAVSGIAPSPARHQIIRSALRRSTAMRKKQTISSEIYLYPRTSNASVPSLPQGRFVDEGTESLGASKSSSAAGALLGMDLSSNVPVASPFVGLAASENRRRPVPSSYEAPHVFYNMSETRETIIGALANRAKKLRSGGKVGRERMRNWLGRAVKSSSDVVKDVKNVVDEEFVWI